MEALVLLPWLCPTLDRPSVLFRPIDNPTVDRWVHATRQRWGCTLLSRRADLLKLKDSLTDNRWAVALYDQHAAKSGVLTFYFDRVASTTELPAALAVRYKAPVYMIAVERTGLWSGNLRMERLLPGAATSSAEVVRAANQWLEEYLSSSDNRCA